MDLTNYLAQVWGITIVIASLSLILNQNYLKKIYSIFEDEKDSFFTGLLLFVAGIAIVLSHNLWVKNWRIIITLMGWFLLIKGFFILILPEVVKNLVKKIENKDWLPLCLLSALIFGLALTYLGFTQ